MQIGQPSGLLLGSAGGIRYRGKTHSSPNSFLRAALPGVRKSRAPWSDVTYCGVSLGDLKHRLHTMWQEAYRQGFLRPASP